MINSVQKAIDILELFSREEPTLTLAEVCERLSLPKGTAHNLLKTLASRGYIEKIDKGNYALGAAVIPLTQAARVNVELRDRAAPLLRSLSDACHESVYLTILDKDVGLYIYAVELPGRLLARSAVGERVPLHCTSVGKAILSWLPPENVKEIINRTGLAQFTPATITNPEILFQELEQTRQRGFSLDAGEHESGVYCVGAPIFKPNGEVLAACSISSRDAKVVGQRAEEITTQVMLTAQEISRQIGYIPNRVSDLASFPKED
jgi:DNA-binding IclR family transcriptional regulator